LSRFSGTPFTILSNLPYRSRSVFFGRSYAAFTRWQNPWSELDSTPPAIECETILIPHPERPLKAWMYSPKTRGTLGGILLLPGLHYLGPTDPRSDRFARVLASAGIRVFVPFLPDFMTQIIRPSVVGDVEVAFEKFLEYEDQPGIFSISFGSFPALHLASHPKWASQIGGMITFGGYGDWLETIRLAMARAGTGKEDWDPLNTPVIFMNFLPYMPGAPNDSEPLFSAWRRYIERTWGDPTMKDPRKHSPIAREIAQTVSEAERKLFLQGCGLEPGGEELFEVAQAQSSGGFDFLTPLSGMSGIRCPVTVIHSAGDDVIPIEQADRIWNALPSRSRRNKIVTGLVSHSGHNIPTLGPRMVHEFLSMIRIMRATISIARTG
jgi:pimeloyl-ACP methyl ester carboxylesterase